MNCMPRVLADEWAIIVLFLHVKRDFIIQNRSCCQEGPYNHDSTASRLLSEVKHDLDLLVLRWGTTTFVVVVLWGGVV